MGKLFGHIAFGACIHACVNFCVPIATLKLLKLESRNFIYRFLIKQCTLFFSLLSTILELWSFENIKIHLVSRISQKVF